MSRANFVRSCSLSRRRSSISCVRKDRAVLSPSSSTSLSANRRHLRLFISPPLLSSAWAWEGNVPQEAKKIPGDVVQEGSSDPHPSRTFTWVGRPSVTTPLVIGRVVGDVDRRELQVKAAVFCPPCRQLGSSVCIARRSATCSRSRDGCCVSVLLSWRLLLSNGLVAIENVIASFLLNGSLVQDNTAQ